METTNENVPEPDRTDQAPPPRPGEVPADVPEADALEQAQPVDDEETGATHEPRTIREDVPEADALEQAQEVPGEGEERR